MAFLRASMSAAASVLRLAQTGFGEMEKRFVVGLERVGAERLEGLAKCGLGLFVRSQSFGVNSVLLVEFSREAGVRGTTSQPADKRAKAKADDERADRDDRIDTH